MKSKKNPLETGFHALFLFCGVLSVGFVLFITVYLVISGVPAIGQVGIGKFLLGEKWSAGSQAFGILPFILTSVYGTAGAVALAIPLGILTAVFLAKDVPGWLARLIHTAVELLAGIPSVVYGLVGMIVLVPAIQKTFGMSSGACLLTAMNRLMLIEIAKGHGLEIEEEVKYGSREHLEKADYIIAKQRELIEEQQSRIANQDATIAQQATIIAAKDAELTDKVEKLDEVDALLDEVADIAYDKAVSTITATTIGEVQRENAAAADKLIAQVDDPKSGMKKAECAAAVGVLTKLKSAMLEMPKKLFDTMMSKLARPAVREAAKKKIVDKAKPSILSMLQGHGRSGNGRQRYDEAR